MIYGAYFRRKIRRRGGCCGCYRGTGVWVQRRHAAAKLPHLRKAGRLVFVGYTPGRPIELMPHELVRGEFEVYGSRATTKQELADTMDLVA